MSTGARLTTPTGDLIRTLKGAMDTDSGREVARLQRVGRHSFRLDAAPRCESPVNIEMTGRPLRHGRGYTAVGVSAVGKLADAPLWLDIQARCRRCGPCREYRRRLWIARAIAEISRAPRTWFVTLTLRPDRQFYYLELARRYAAARGQDLDLQKPDQKFIAHAHSVMKAVTLMIKRIRKNTKGNIRYLAVAEEHESGYPHVHMLIHDLDVLNFVRKAQIQSEWHEGFSLVKLADKGTAFYITKYVAKALTTRIRASLHYGHPEDAGMCVNTQDPLRGIANEVLREGNDPQKRKSLFALQGLYLEEPR